MSFEVDWEQLLDDSSLNSTITQRLDNFVQSLSLPSYLQDLQILDFQLGNVPPKCKLKSLTDPHPEIEPNPHQNDIQALVELEYCGDMVLSLQVSLVLNYPGDRFMTLPVKVTISQLRLHCLCLVAHLASKLQTLFSILCDINNDNNDLEETISNTSTTATQHQPWGSSAPLQRMAVVQSLNIETEIGDNVSSGQDRASTLRNVDKLEQFLLAKFKDFIRNEIGWPNMITFDYNSDEEEDGKDQDPTANGTEETD
ncbi:mitochondrial distribution and morphology protein 12 [Monosporozyma unispora]|nr:Mitochondrial distribution and morphology protein 12 [Kazachstania unispora]